MRNHVRILFAAILLTVTAGRGSNYSITLYDENDEILVSKGGYMPTSKKFTSLYKNIKEILAAYDINQIVDAHREILSVE